MLCLEAPSCFEVVSCSSQFNNSKVVLFFNLRFKCLFSTCEKMKMMYIEISAELSVMN